ncbi:hypothetical protein G3570_06700 [Balneolaceae bacterium YR4-1]|uniref:Uncharacterized protein n=1 Tax=Halalkalibaculum roseum TaxID=2709311 RepID=A0A6M1T7R8_9BACT|nr:hypothetical protein [Halalkalibaculum roseum]NGP76313.1 hypothetical protein [Halalkalibaculum roseum]
MTRNKLRKLYLAVIILLFAIPEAASGQYFGRNQVQYEDFDFQILHTEHFDIYHYPQEEKAVKDLGKLSERWYQRHSATLNHTFKTKNLLIIYAVPFQRPEQPGYVGFHISPGW